MRRISAQWRNDGGSTAAEYALIASLIAIVALAGILLLGDSVFGLFDSSAESISDATGG
jgi:Flp pilus assembly pilin Flp